MSANKPVVTITAEQWTAKKVRGQVAVIGGRPYIVMAHESTREPVYQPVAIVNADTQR